MNRTASIVFALLAGSALTLRANPITKSEARQVAQSLVGISDTSGDDVPVAPYYVFSRGAGRGYVIASGDDSTAPILGYTEQGDYAAAALPPQLQQMLALWSERIGEVQRRPQPQHQRLSAPRRAIADFKKQWTSVAPLLKTHWHQDSPYNMLAPVKQGVGRCMTGCVATAGSQVTYYFHKDNPAELAYATPTYGYGTPVTVSLPKGTSIDWDLMKLSGKGTARQDSAVAKLMYALGTSAWLTYGDGDGLATSGHNNNMAEAMKGQFRLNYSYKTKTDYSQQEWEELIYQNLTTKRPMLYSGAHPENGGHSVCLDGYQATTGLYHFNFGWGGQGDGYYTVDDATGMNGFNTYQDLVFNITPQKQNLKAEAAAGILYHKAANSVEVKVTNDGTLDYQGIYVYLGKLRDKVTTTAVGRDLNTVIAAGETVTIPFDITPTTTSASFLQVCDKSRNIILSLPMEIVSSVADLHLDSVAVDAGSATETLDGMDFRVVNSNSPTVTVTLTNGADGTFCQPTLKCHKQRYDKETRKWETFTTDKSSSTQTFGSGQTQQVEFFFPALDSGEYYRAWLDDKAMASLQCEIQMDGHSPYVYFTVREADLDIAVDGRHATVTGHWNPNIFAQKARDASVCSYDISALSELNVKPAAANPNALFYTTAEHTALAAIENVVVGDVCQRMCLRTGADFKPLRPFTAVEASLALADAEPGKWHGALLPFAAEMPYGMQVKRAAEYVTTGLATIGHEATRSVEAMSVVTYLTSRTGLNTITASHVDITTDTVATFFDGILQAATLATQLQPKSLVLGEYIGSLYYVAPDDSQTLAEAFQPVVVGASAVRVRTTSETLVDGYYRSLSATIDEAYAAIGEYPSATARAVAALRAEIAAAQDMLTYRSHTDNEDVRNCREALTKAVRAFREAAEQETPVVGDVNGDGTVDVADIATVITLMAGAADGTDAGMADVNGDGTVDVADIATVISIMAGSHAGSLPE